VADVRFARVSKSFTPGTRVIRDLNLHVRDHEFLVLVGPSGCGKSTALRMIAGLEEVSDGDLFIGERRVNDIAPKDRDIAMVFQNYALYPHMTVQDNLSFSLKLRRMGAAEVDGRVRRAARMLGIGEHLRRRPRELFGGQRQRVALGRALVRDPKVFLLDEPLSNLDAKLRVQMRAEISRLHQTTGTTFVYVTHDQVEAMTMGDRIAVMNAGVIQQLGTPHELYDAPANLFVAGFIGSPAMDLFEATLMRGAAGAGGADVVIGAGADARRLSLTGRTAERVAGQASASGRPVIVGIRPEHLRLSAANQPDTLTGVVEVLEHLGNELLAYVRIPGAITSDTAETQGTVARLPAGADVAIGQTVSLVVETGALHVFDPATTAAFR
jgi:multiple sugar transport system ATP-binding protein